MVEVIFDSPPLGPPRECRVFIANEPRGFDLSDLARFGHQTLPILPMRAIFPDQADVYEASVPSMVYTFLREHRFMPDKDYFALVGDPLCTACCMFGLARLLDNVTVLRFDGQAKVYWPFTMRLNRGENRGKVVYT